MAKPGWHVLKKPAVRDVFILIIVMLSVTLPFINQAFHWDDRDFIEQAEVIAQDPGKFHQEDYSSRGRFFPRFPFRHPPLTSYYLALFIHIGGVSEPLFHAGYLVFPVIAAVSMYSLGRRFTRSPLAAASLFVLTPGVMVMSHTVMGNMPGVSLWLAATALFIWGADRGSWRLLLLAGLVMALDIMTFAQALGLVPILFFYALINRRFRVPIFLSLVIPLAIYAFWRYYIRFRYGHPPAISYRVELNYNWQARDLITFLGGSVFFPVSAWILFLRRKIDVLIGFLALPPIITWASIYFISQGDLNLVQGLQVAVLAGAGFLILYGLLAAFAQDCWILIKKRKILADNLFLLAWIAGVVSAYFFSSLPFVAVRHMLPLFAPVVLLFFREAEKLWPRRPRFKTVFVAATLLLTGVFAISASVADYRMADVYRSTAERMAQEYGDSPVKVWALGEFDWRFYMEKNGFEYLGIKSTAKPGDIVLSSEICSQGVVAPLPAGFYTILSRSEPGDDFPVRTMNPWAKAGFYGNPLGPLPVAISGEKMDEITVNRLDW